MTVGGAAVAGVSKGDRTRRRILDAAAGQFSGRGLAAVSMADVAAAAGMKAGSLYFHFASKDDLIDAVVGVGIAEAFAFVEQAVGEHDDATGSAPLLLRAIEAHLIALRDLSDYASVVAQGTSDRGARSGGSYLGEERRYAKFWIRLLLRAQREGVVAPDLDVRVVRDLLFGALNAETMRSREPEDVASVLGGLIGLWPRAAATSVVADRPACVNGPSEGDERS